MPECNYCGDSFDDEKSYLHHLKDDHEGELGTIDQRRVEEELVGDGSGLPTGPLILVGVLLVAVLIVVYVVFFFGSGGATPSDTTGVSEAGEADPAEITQTPGPERSTHEHGTIEVVIDGQAVDFSQQEYQLQADKFHFENGNGRVWHKHATGVTLEWAMATLGIGVSEDTVVFNGQVYRDSDSGTNVTVTVNGEAVDPQTYVLQGVGDTNPQQGDQIRIVVETENGG